VTEVLLVMGIESRFPVTADLRVTEIGNLIRVTVSRVVMESVNRFLATVARLAMVKRNPIRVMEDPLVTVNASHFHVTVGRLGTANANRSRVMVNANRLFVNRTTASTAPDRRSGANAGRTNPNSKTVLPVKN
jgi:hypothetical protein